jgi:3D (Asp-Asp-Asp) domain-containing protein
MADGTLNVHVESSFLTLSDGATDADIDYSVEEADNIGKFTIPVGCELSITTSGIQYISTAYTTISGVDGFTSTAITYQHTNTTTMSGVLTSVVEYGIPVSVSGLSDELDVDLNYFVITDADKLPGHRRMYVSSVMGEAYVYSDNIFTQYWTFSPTSGTLDYGTLYTAGGDYDPTDPLDYVIIYGTADYPAQFNLGDQSTLVSGSVRAFIDSFFAGYVYYFKPDELSYRFSATCGLENTVHGYNLDSTAISGAVTEQ